MAQRLDLQVLLEGLVAGLHVYFQPPSNVRLEYPCIVYKRDDANTQHADNRPYKSATRYQLTIIDPDPDSDIPGLVAELPYCTFNRFYTADNLNHDVYNLFF